MPSRPTVASNHYQNIDNPLFDRFTIHKDYSVSKLINGRNVRIVEKDLLTGINGVDYLTDAELLDKIKNGDYLKGSFGVTHDLKKRGWIHKLIFYIQKTHAFITRRRKNFDPYHCHSFIVTNAGAKFKDANRPLPFIIVHACDGGIRTAKQDYIQKKDVTSVVIYRPRDEAIRNSIIAEAAKTAYIEDKIRRNACPQCPSKKGKFKKRDALLSTFHNQKHKVCGKHGRRSRPSSAVTKRTAYLVADFLLDKQVLNRRGKPRSLYCSAYAMYVFQRGLMNNHLSSMTDDQKSKFLKDKNGKPLKRSALAKKIDSTLKGKYECEFGKAIHQQYTNNKLSRLDARYIMSGYVAKAFNKRVHNGEAARATAATA